LGKKDLIKKIPFKNSLKKIPSPKKVAAADCFAAWDIAFYYIDGLYAFYEIKHSVSQY
jgi:hypothetical protein